MAIHKYQIINHTTNAKMPFFDEKKGIFYLPVNHIYRYFVEAVVANTEEGGYDYFFLLSKTKFDNNCRLCNTDGYGRCQIKIRGDMKEYIVSELKGRGTVDVEYIESTDGYDVFKVN